MALIKCCECSKEISDKAASCIHCGAPIIAEKKEELIQCYKCGSTELTAQKKGYSGGKALGGALLTGGIGLLAGTIGSKKINITCLKCGHKFKPGEDKKSMIKTKKAEEDFLKSPIGNFFFVIGLIFIIYSFIQMCN
jgi:DNA-directed RNA polymerase subunit RPC12/RpoP